jgi:predicted branched-subunit amino acid permease
MSYKPKNILDELLRDKEGRIVVMQVPNGAIIGWAVCTALGAMVGQGIFHHAIHFMAQVFLLVWTYEEIRTGESLFRRILGGVVLIVLVLSFFR